MRRWQIAGLLMLATVGGLPAQTFITFVTFSSKNGANPAASLVQGTDGNFYGTTYTGGTEDSGTIFKVTSNGEFTTIHSFTGTDGFGPEAPLLLTETGAFWGSTGFGGAGGLGTIFELTAVSLNTIHTFAGPDGAQPMSGLVQSPDTGAFFGTTHVGGASNVGTVFTIAPSGTLTTLRSFGEDTPRLPLGAIVRGINGDYYGTTQAGGAEKGCCGAFYSITPDGSMLDFLHSFSPEQGESPEGGVLLADHGHYYGTAAVGGAGGKGTIFMISDGTATDLHYFCTQADCPDGSLPVSALIQGTDGNLYGTTSYGGSGECGTVFMVTLGGSFTTLHSFSESDGCNPTAGLVQGTDGSFYGVTSNGGSSSKGTVFKLSTGLGPYIVTLPTSGHVGATVKILGTNMTAPVSVTFNGVAAVVIFASPTEIATTVPSGATGGPVTVTTGDGTVLISFPFVVVPLKAAIVNFVTISRRTILAALPAAAAVAQAARSQNWKPKLGVLGDYSEANLAFVKAEGFTSMQLRLNPEHLDDSAIAAIKDNIARSGIYISSLAVDGNHIDPDSDKRAKQNEYAAKCIELAGKLGIPNIGGQSGTMRGRPLAEQVDEIVKVYTEKYFPLCEKNKVRILWEPYAGGPNIATGPIGWEALFKAFNNSPHVGLQFDPSHLVWQFMDPVAAAREFADKIYDVHLKDTEILWHVLHRCGIQPVNRASWWRFRIPGDGSMDWKGFFTVLADAGYSGAMNIENEDDFFYPAYSGHDFTEPFKRGFRQAHAFLKTLVPPVTAS